MYWTLSCWRKQAFKGLHNDRNHHDASLTKSRYPYQTFEDFQVYYLWQQWKILMGFWHNEWMAQFNTKNSRYRRAGTRHHVLSGYEKQTIHQRIIPPVRASRVVKAKLSILSANNIYFDIFYQLPWWSFRYHSIYKSIMIFPYETITVPYYRQCALCKAIIVFVSMLVSLVIYKDILLKNPPLFPTWISSSAIKKGWVSA